MKCTHIKLGEDFLEVPQGFWPPTAPHSYYTLLYALSMPYIQTSYPIFLDLKDVDFGVLPNCASE